MTKNENHLLLRQAMRLTFLGITIENDRGKLKKLVEQGVPYSDPKMLEALERFNLANAEWKRLEAAHLTLKNKLSNERRQCNG